MTVSGRVSLIIRSKSTKEGALVPISFLAASTRLRLISQSPTISTTVAIAFHDLLPPSKGAASTGTDEGHPQPSLGGPRSANNRTSRKGQGCAARNERASRDC